MNKIVLLILLSILPFLAKAQQGDSTKYAGQKNPWISILDLDYENVETVETVTSDYWVEGNESKLFVYTKNDGVRYFRIYTPKKGTRGKRSIKEKKLNAKQQNYYQELLPKLRANNFTNVRADSLNIIQRGANIMRVSSGTTFRFRYIGYDYYKDFMTQAPDRYIDQQFPGWMQRVKMLNLIIDFNKMVKRFQIHEN